MDEKEAEKVRDDLSCHLISKGRLVLTVEVRTEKEAEQIMQWMYGKEKPMKAALLEIAWDKAVVPIAVAEALEMLKKALTNHGGF